MKGTVCAEIGRVSEKQRLCIKGLDGEAVVDASLAELLASWKKTLSSEV